MSNKIVSILIVLIIIAGGVFLFNNKSGAPTEVDDLVTGTEMQVPANGSNVDEMVVAGDSTTFTVEGANFSFAPNTMKVKVGDKVKIIFKNTEGVHDFNLDEFNVHTGVITAGKEVAVEFTADKAGSFEYYCAVGDHRAKGMVGTLTVEN